MQQLQGAALSPATKRAYATGSKRYMSFCRKYSITPFPTTQLTLCYFAAYISKQVQHATIRLYLAAVRAEQLSRGLEDPLKDTQQLSWLLRGVQRQSKTRTRLPINPKLLLLLIQSILSNRHLIKYDRYLYATAISIAYFGCLRAGEISYPSTHSFNPKQHLTIKDVTIHQSTVQLRLKCSKTDQFRRGATIIIGASKQDICPVQITKQFLHLRKHAHKSDAIFRLRDGSLLTRPRLQAIIRNTLHSLKLPAELFGTHSLRIGSATAAAEAGIPMKIIKAMGRWSSDCYRSYIRTPHRILRSLTSKLCAS